MSSAISEADLDAVNADLLPPQARQLVRLIGLPNALKILEARGGITLRIPVNAQEAVVLKEIVPIEAIIALCQALGGQRLELPKLDKIVLQIRNQAMQQERKTLSAPQVARRYGLTRRQVINICRPVEDDRQADLFE
ncbi:MAG: Mor transcription activator family protein [Gammaproteobacteria bacterium]